MARTGFGKYIHDHIIKHNVGTCELSIDSVVCQYNPDRYALWLMVADTLHIEDSPHWELAKNGNESRYKKYQYLLGRREEWIDKKVDGFKTMINQCQNGLGIVESPQVLTRPIKKNPNWSGGKYEIWEGHHRISASLAWCNKTIADVYEYEIIN